MKQHRLNIQTSARPDVLERVLRVVRHRGFRLCALNMASGADSQLLQVTMTVESERPIQLLSTQLDKLHDVTHVEAQLLEPASQSAFQIRA